MEILSPIAFYDVSAGTNAWLSILRPRPVKLITIHTTRGGSAGYRTEYDGTISWSRSPNNNRGGWGSSEQRVVQGRDIAIIVPDNRMATYGAGYAGPGSVFAVDEYSLNLEIAQMGRDTPIEPPTFDTAARQCAAWCIQYGIPAVRIPYLAQNTPLAVGGLVGHEDTDNGRILGKSDPGPMFDWPGFIALTKKYVQEETAPPSLPPPPPVPKEEDEMAKSAFVRVKNRSAVYRVDGDRLVHAVNPTYYELVRGDTSEFREVEPTDRILDMPTLYPLGVPKELR